MAVAATVLGCSPERPNEIASRNQALTTSNGLFQNGLVQNGLFQNGLTSNGLFQNGLFQNGLFQNGLFQNGLFQNGLFQNGLFQNGLFQNGLFQNGVWENGLFQNGVWQTGLTGDAAFPGNTLRNSPYARELLQYIYSCAMPPATYDTTLDPNNGALLCSSPDGGSDGGAECDAGYTCSSADAGTQGTCVIPLKGVVGVGINADGTSWGASGICDESCQRWVTACVLARTNAYGVHVEISMRAPDDAPQAIKDALKLANGEASPCPDGSADDPTCGYTLREGAYYGNIFETTPVNPEPSPSYSGPAIGPIAQAPVFYACAGPDSNIPEITKRFCSSQGDQSVIKVPGVCLATATEAGMCTGAIAGPGSGSETMQDCYTTPSTQPRGQCADYRDPNCYNEVITVYLKTPVAVCGNGVCEAGENDTSGPGYCPSDCHPGSWAKDYTSSLLGPLAGSVADAPRTFGEAENFAMFALAPDDTVVVAGVASGDVDLGGGTIPRGSGAIGVLAKYNSDGTYAWGHRIGGSSQTAVGGALSQVNGVTIASNGEITVVGFSVGLVSNVVTWELWSGTYAPDGTPLRTWSLEIGNTVTSPPNFFLYPSHALAIDSAGDIIMAGGYAGVATFGTTSFTSTGFVPNSPTAATNDIYVTKVTPQGAVMWAQTLGGDGLDFPRSLAVDSADDIVLLTANNNTDTLQKWSSDGSPLWAAPKTPGANARYTVATVTRGGDIYVGGHVGSGADLGGGSITSIFGFPPFLMKLNGDGTFQWARYPNMVAAPATDLIDGAMIAFDPAGNAVLASIGNPGIGGSIDFGIGAFPTYASDNVFLAAYSMDAGQLQWAKQIPIILESGLLGMAVDGQGRILVGGLFSGSMLADDELLVTTVPEQPRTVDSFLSSFGSPSPSDTMPPAIGAGADAAGTPLFTLPSNIVAQATGPSGATIFFMPPTAIDTGNAGTSVKCSPAPNTTFPINTAMVPSTLVTCTASDPLGNQSTATFTVTVVDTLGPVLFPIADVTVQATGASGASVTYTPTATDQVDGSRPVTCTPPSGSTFPVGQTTVTCIASDTRQNRSSTTFSVNVTPPPITVTCVGTPTSPAILSTSPGVCGATVNTSDAGSCSAGAGGGALCSFDGTSSEILGPGNHSVLVVGSVAGGSTASCTSYVRVADSEKPAVTCASHTVQCTGGGGATVTPGASCTDNCSCTTSCATALFPVGTSSGACTATDPSGNSATCQPVITVVDATPPVVTPRPGSSQLQCRVDTWSDPGATAVDQCVGDLSASVKATGGVDPTHVGTYTVTYSVADPSGNAASAARSVSVVDTLPPKTSATVGPNPAGNRYINIDITSYSVTPKGGGSAVTGAADCWTSPGIAIALNAVDACSLKQITYALTGAQTGGASVAGGLATVNVTKMGSTTVSYFATDTAGNTGATNTLPIFVGHATEGFGFSCAPSPSLRALPSHGTVTATGTVTITNPLTGKKVTEAFSFTQSY
jgi:hypothetical protein